jgi:hypothetical protein
MFRAEAITIIKRGLGFRQTQDAAIIAALKEAQRDLELGQTLPNWLLEFDVPVIVAADTGLATTPPGFIRLHEDYPVWHQPYVGANLIELGRKRGNEAGLPYHKNVPYFVLRDKETLEFVPPLATDSLAYVTYYKGAALLDSNLENEWLKFAPNYLIGLAGAKVAGDVRDKGAMEKFGIMAKIGSRGLLGDIIEDELAGRPLILGRNN